MLSKWRSSKFATKLEDYWQMHKNASRNSKIATVMIPEIRSNLAVTKYFSSEISSLSSGKGISSRASILSVYSKTCCQGKSDLRDVLPPMTPVACLLVVASPLS